MAARRVNKKQRMENLHGSVGILRGGNARDNRKVVVNEFTQPPVVIHGASLAAPTHKQFKIRNAKCILNIDQQKPCFLLITRSRLDAKPVPIF